MASRRWYLRACWRNVLDAHANQLYYDEATSLYNADFQPPLPPGTAESVIERTFRVLTRRWAARGAQLPERGRNHGYSGRCGADLAGGVSHFAAFPAGWHHVLLPFVLEEADDHEVLPPDVVLDITHESLIRNWKHLAEWAGSEAEEVLHCPRPVGASRPLEDQC